MANFCLPRPVADKFKKALGGRLHPSKLVKMSSEERRRAFTDIMGPDGAIEVNRLFESKLLLVNQEQGMISWIKQLTGIDQAKRDAMSLKVKNRYAERKRRMLLPTEQDKFLGELVTDYYNRKLKTDISLEEARHITDLATRAEDYRANANEDGVFKSREKQLQYGLAHVEYLDYIGDLKLQATSLPFREVIRSPKEITLQASGFAKSVVASLDNSFFGRQGLKILATNPKAWAKAFAKSWVDIGKGLMKVDAMKAIRAEVYSSPNALNGKYAAGGGYDLGVDTEEEFPSSLPERIPGLGRLFKASENAFNGAALRLRAITADKLIARAEKQGVDVYNKEEAEGMASLAGSMTGRAKLGKGEVFAKETNVLFFSLKFLLSNVHTLTGHQLDPKATKFTKKEAAGNLARIVIGVAGILAMADWLGDDDTVEWDPRSSGFGKIKIGDTRFDVTGGMASIIVLASRLIPTIHNGELGFWRKSSTTGNYTKSGSGFGETSAWDTLVDFGEGKLSPFASIFRDILRGEMFGGKPATPENLVRQSTTPISIQNLEESLENPDSAHWLLTLIVDGLGWGSTTYPAEGRDWSQSDSKEMTQFREQVGEKKLKEANDKYNRDYNQWFKDIKFSEAYKELSDEEKKKLLTKNKEDIKKDVFREYKFKPKKD